MKRDYFRIATALALAAALGAAAALAQSASKPVVKAKALLETDGAHPGAKVRAAVVAEISPGFHINDHKPLQDYLIPTELTLEPNNLFSVAKIVYPKGEAKKFAFSDQPLLVYEGTLAVGALLEVARNAAPGVHTLKGKFAYQACNDHACLPPASVPVTLEVKVVPRQTALNRVNTDVFRGIQFD
jgi:DsbC/DsbD-like thiol-disulfide interchange protein